MNIYDIIERSGIDGGYKKSQPARIKKGSASPRSSIIYVHLISPYSFELNSGLSKIEELLPPINTNLEYFCQTFWAFTLSYKTL